MSEWRPSEIVDGTADAAFISDSKGLVAGWNQAASDLLGFLRDEVVGTPCHTILCGRDLFGNQYCGEHCAIQSMVAKSDPVRRFAIDVRHALGHRIQVQVSIVRLRETEQGSSLILHILVPRLAGPLALAGSSFTSLPSAEPSAVPVVDRGSRIESLTPREVEVLSLLATGNASQDIANELFISLTTVRTHIQNILRKLDVHSQLEAVALAFRKGLI